MLLQKSKDAYSFVMEVIKEQPQWFKDALAVDYKSDFANIAGAKIHFMEWGDPNNPSVIMLHGNHAHAHWFRVESLR